MQVGLVIAIALNLLVFMLTTADRAKANTVTYRAEISDIVSSDDGFLASFGIEAEGSMIAYLKFNSNQSNADTGHSIHSKGVRRTLQESYTHKIRKIHRFVFYTTNWEIKRPDNGSERTLTSKENSFIHQDRSGIYNNIIFLDHGNSSNVAGDAGFVHTISAMPEGGNWERAEFLELSVLERFDETSQPHEANGVTWRVENSMGSHVKLEPIHKIPSFTIPFHPSAPATVSVPPNFYLLLSCCLTFFALQIAMRIKSNN